MVAHLILETTNEGVWLIDAQARTTFVNHAAAELLGYTETEMVGRHVFDFVDESRRTATQASLMRRQRGIEDRQEVRLRRKDGTFIWVIGSSNPVYDQEGRYAGALCLFGDLTSQKRTEEQLRVELAKARAKLAELASTVGTKDGKAEWSNASVIRESMRAAATVALGTSVLGLVGLLAIAGIAGDLWSSVRGRARDDSRFAE